MPKYENKKTWTVGELKKELEKYSDDIKVTLEDADTSWTIPIFSVCFDVKSNTVWFNPCDYSEMTK